MNPSNRIPILAALAVGLLLIVYGLVSGSQDEGENEPQPHLNTKDSFVAELAGARRSPADLVAPDAQPAAQALAAQDTTLLVGVTYLQDGSPAVNERIGLWRAATGEGPAFRPARRLTELATDADGNVSFTVPSGTPLEIYGRARQLVEAVAKRKDAPPFEGPVAGPVAKALVPPLEKGAERRMTLVLERPPSPLDLLIFDGETSNAIAGAAVRSVALSRQDLGLEDFPGTAQLEGRSNGSGTVTLRGPVRKTRWLIIDAAGYAPIAIRSSTFDGRMQGQVSLARAGRVDVTVLGADSQPAKDVTVRLIASLGGGDFRTTYTGSSNARGELSLRGLPVGSPLLPQADVEGEDTQPFSAITLNAGESRRIELGLR